MQESAGADSLSPRGDLSRVGRGDRPRLHVGYAVIVGAALGGTRMVRIAGALYPALMVFVDRRTR